MSVFIDRERELEILNERYESDRAEFFLLYGRRRIGKSRLIEQFLGQNGVEGIKLLAREESKKLQLEGFKNKLADFFKDDLLKKMEFTNWDAFFEYLAAKSSKKIVFAIDEFPYLVKEDKSLPSILQDYWDTRFNKTKIFIILSGSSIRMMESFMGYRNPLYGRRTGQILLRPLKFVHIFHHLKNLENAVRFYSVFGGTPAYSVEIDINKSIEENIKEKILKEESFVYRDVEFILRQELDEPRYYFSILLSLSRGNHTMGLICNDTGLSKSIVNKYLSTLIDLHLVKREVPVTESYKSKKGYYYVADNLFEFYFHFVYPYTDDLEGGKIERVFEKFIKPYLNQYTGKYFENIVLEIFRERDLFDFTKIGRQWGKIPGAEKGKNTYEIDIVALNDQTKEILFAECKWKDRVNTKEVLKKLKEKSKCVKWNNEKRKEHYAIFAKSFKNRDVEGVKLFDLKDLEEVFK